MLLVGVLEIQGDVEEHVNSAERALENLGARGKVLRIKDNGEMGNLSCMIIPGGESTVISRFLSDDMRNGIGKLLKRGGAVMGTCAGTILLAKECGDAMVRTLGLMDMKAGRNAYGRQRDSFEKTLDVSGIGDFNCVFIRAPVIESVGRGVEILSSHEGKPVLVRQGRVLAATFHPELTNDARIHEYFLKLPI